jgi:translation initiation factor 3 subunit A
LLIFTFCLSFLFRLAILLRQTAMPSRESLISEINARGLLRQVSPEVALLFRTLETDFSPLMLAARCVPCFEKLRSSKQDEASANKPTAHLSALSFAQYIPQLERLVVLRTLQQLSSVYSNVTLSQLRKLFGGLSISQYEIEALVLRVSRQRLLAVRIDHREGCMRFGSDLLEVSSVRRSLTELATRLKSVIDDRLPSSSSKLASTEEQRSFLFKLARESAREDPQLASKRQEEIERRKYLQEVRKKQLEKEVSLVKKILIYLQIELQDAAAVRINLSGEASYFQSACQRKCRCFT